MPASPNHIGMFLLARQRPSRCRIALKRFPYLQADPLEHGTPEAAAFLEQLDRARVVGNCRCGCASIDFEIDGLGKAPPGVHILGDFIYGDESNLCGVFVFESAGILSGLEVYSFAVDTPKTLPNPPTSGRLLTWNSRAEKSQDQRRDTRLRLANGTLFLVANGHR